MRVKVVTLALEADARRFDDGPLQRALAEDAVVHVAHHALPGPDGPLLAFVLTCADAAPTAAPAAAPAEAPPVAAPTAAPRARFDAERDVPASARPCFEALRAWRNARAREEDVPGYRVLTNRALAALAALRPRTVAELAEVPGVGEATLARHGDALLAELRPWAAGDAAGEG